MGNIKKQTILAVDDSPESLDTIKCILTPNFKVIPVINGKIALKVAQEQPLSLILLDIMMPKMDGFEVCRQLKANQANKNIPILFLTGKSTVKDEAKGLMLGASDFIMKPIDPMLLVSRVRLHLHLFERCKKIEKTFQDRISVLEGKILSLKEKQ
jgi:DNA-binding response OmpR family regulator